MTDPIWQALATTSATVDRLTRDHRAVTANMAAGVSSTTSSAGTPDPAGTVEWTSVEAAALRRIRSQAGRYQDLIERALGCLLEADIIRALTVTADTTRLASQLRCDGGQGEWDDPTCDRTGVKDVWVNGHHHWLCQRCWDRYRQWKRREVSA
jgi:hypothetical protein